GMICNSPSSINPMSGAFGCDPALGSCCDISFRHPGYLSEYPNDSSPCGGEYHICCLGNSSVQDASLPLGSLTNDPVGRCPMSSSLADNPRRFCQACLSHARNTTPHMCGNTFDGMKRLLEVRMIAEPGVRPVLVSYRSGVDGRAGWQEHSTADATDALLRFQVRGTGYELATRPFPSTTAAMVGEEQVGAERLL